MVHKNWDKKFLAFLHRFNSLASEKERGSKVKNIFFHCTLFSLSFFFSFFKVSSILVIFSSTLEKSGWREKVFISSVLERRLIFRVLVRIIALWIFLDFSVPRMFPLSRSLSLWFPTRVYDRKEIARPVASACWKFPFFNDRFEYREEDALQMGEILNESNIRKRFSLVSRLSYDYLGFSLFQY